MKLKVFLEIDDNYIEDIKKESILFDEFKKFITHKLISNSDIKLYITKGKISKFVNTFDKVIKAGKIDYWQKENSSTLLNDFNTSYLYYQWNYSTLAIQLDPSLDVIVEIAKFQIFHRTPCLLITSFTDSKYNNNSIYVIRDNFERSPYSSYWEEIKYTSPELKKDTNNNFINKNFEEWYNAYKNNRIHKANPKHDKNRPIANKNEKVSLLLCNQDEAQELLINAVNGSASEEGFPKFLYNYDKTQKKYIEFKLERITDEKEAIYHGYHLDSFTEIEQKIQNKSVKNQLFDMSK
ncbi:MAG: hypothetical protein KDK54_19890 [Leptospiraceae bacterium]|nr:hypothetical protein [Leptospiraceae bacterium]